MTDDRTLGEAFRQLSEAKRVCAERAARHVDLALYTSEMDSLRRELARTQEVARAEFVLAQDHARNDTTAAAEALRQELARLENEILRERQLRHEAETAAAEEKREWLRQRRQLWIGLATAAVVPFLTFLFGLLWFLLFGTPEGSP